MNEFFSELVADPAIAKWLPFFFILAVVYGLLSITPIKWPKSVNLIIALVFAFFASGSPSFMRFFFKNFDLVLWVFVGIFFFVLFIEVVQRVRKVGITKGREEIPMIFGLVSIILLITVGVGALPAASGIVAMLGGQQNFLIAVGLLLLVIVFYFAYELGRPRGIEELEKEIQKRKLEKQKELQEEMGG